MDVQILPHVNAGLNALAAMLLVVGVRQIRRGRERLHRRLMLTCFAVSVVFLGSYLFYHSQAGHKHFSATAPTAIRVFYLLVLLTHTILAATVPILAGMTIYFGLRDRRDIHRRFARWTYPIWLYVSITGVVVYLMLYQLYPSAARETKVSQSASQRFDNVDHPIRPSAERSTS